MTSSICPLSAAAARHGDEVAIKDGNRVISYRQLNSLIDAVATVISDSGIEPGDRVCLQMPNSWQYVTSLWSLFRLGAVACPISTRLPGQAAREASRWLKARALWRKADIDSLLQRGENVAPSDAPRHINSTSISTILFSSGSTSRPKAIAHDLRAHIASAKGSNANLHLQTRDRWLLSLPLYHVGGLGIVFRCIMAGATIVVPARSNDLFDNLVNYRITRVSVVPTQLRDLIDRRADPLADLKTILLGGGMVPSTLVSQAIDQGWPLRTTYGLTEMASQVTVSSIKTDLQQRVSSGRVLPGREVRIDDDGEILVRGETLFRGYVTDEGLTQPVATDGWFHTADLGEIDADGNLHVFGRRDNMFISGGENIHPEEIERQLLNISGIRQAIVVPIENERFGHRPFAFVEADVMKERVWRQELQKRLPDFKVPDHFLKWPDSVEQWGMKVNRDKLREIANLFARDLAR